MRSRHGQTLKGINAFLLRVPTQYALLNSGEDGEAGEDGGEVGDGLFRGSDKSEQQNSAGAMI